MSWAEFGSRAWRGIEAFILTAGSTVTGAMIAQGGGFQLPEKAVLIFAGITGLMAAVRNVDSYTTPPSGGAPPGVKP